MLQLKNLMKTKNLTQQDLAEELNVTRGSIYKYLQGKAEPNIDNLKKIADLYDVTVDYLIGHPTKSGLPLTMYTSNQQQIIAMLKELDDAQCLKLIGYIEGMLGKEYIPPKQENFF